MFQDIFPSSDDEDGEPELCGSLQWDGEIEVVQEYSDSDQNALDSSQDGSEAHFSISSEDLNAFWSRIRGLSQLVRDRHGQVVHLVNEWDALNNDERITRVLSAVETLIEQQIVVAFVNGDAECAFRYPNLRSWENVEFHPSYGLLPKRSQQTEGSDSEDVDESNGDQNEILYTTTSLSSKASAKKYSHILLTLYKIWELCLSRSFATKRDIYYQNIKDYRSQADVDSAVTVISAMLAIPRLQLRVLATSKGLVAGSLELINEHGVLVDCRHASSGEAIPQDIDGIQRITSEAR
jgi:meiotic recombination protein SPO11